MLTFLVTERINPIGKYMDRDIHEYIVLENGKTFKWESIAVQAVPGIFYTDRPGDNYVLINGNLLYREVR